MRRAVLLSTTWLLATVCARSKAGQSGVSRAMPSQPLGGQPSPASLQEDLRRVQATYERALNARMRYDLGLPMLSEPYFALLDVERARSKDVAERQLLDEQARVTALSSRLATAQDKVAQAQAKVVDAMTAAGARTHGQLPDVGPTPAAIESPATEPFAMQDEPAPTPSVEQAANGDAIEGVAAVLLRGSEDHSRVGRALFFAKRYDRAREELELAVAKQLDRVDQFYLARSLEALGETGKADELYLQVEVADTTDEDGKKQAGPWARAARVARRQMQWMRDNASWKPARPIEKVEWRSR